MSDKLNQAIADMISQRIEREFFGGAVTNTVAPPSTLDVRKWLPEMQKMLRNFERSKVTFVVDRVHQGPILKHETPNEGSRFEMSWMDANRVHQEWPLKLWKVLSEDAAEFVPITAGEYTPKILPAPPFDVPPEESFKDWVRSTSPRS